LLAAAEWASCLPLNANVSPLLETASRVLAVAVSLWSLPVMADGATPCPNLSGHYELDGKWESAPMLLHGLPPRADQWAFGFVARAVTGASRAVVVHDRDAGSLSVDIIGTGADPLWKDASPSLPFKLVAVCSDGRWQHEHTSRGGGDNTPSTVKIGIGLDLGADGRLVAQGSREVISGYFIRTTTTSKWVASFARIGG
jgi:hypothetical protein